MISSYFDVINSIYRNTTDGRWFTQTEKIHLTEKVDIKLWAHPSIADKPDSINRPTAILDAMNALDLVSFKLMEILITV